MNIEDIISPSTLSGKTRSPVNNKTPEQHAVDWLIRNLYDLTETRDLKEVRYRCSTADFQFHVYLDNKPIFFSHKAKKQWEDWGKKKAPCPPKNYWDDEQGNLINFCPGQILEIQVQFPFFKETACYRLIEEVGYSSWEMNLVEE